MYTFQERALLLYLYRTEYIALSILPFWEETISIIIMLNTLIKIETGIMILFYIFGMTWYQIEPGTSRIQCGLSTNWAIKAVLIVEVNLSLKLACLQKQDRAKCFGDSKDFVCIR